MLSARPLLPISGYFSLVWIYVLPELVGVEQTRTPKSSSASAKMPFSIDMTQFAVCGADFGSNKAVPTTH